MMNVESHKTLFFNGLFDSYFAVYSILIPYVQ